MKTLCALVLTLFLATSAQAAYVPVDVRYATTGSAGNWTLDFTFHNNLINSQNAPGDFIFYKLGLSLPGTSIVDSPLKYNVTGPENGYNHVWTFNNYANDGNPPGAVKQIVPLFAQTELSGFIVHSAEILPPSVASFFMTGSAQPDNGRWGFHSGGMYTGGVVPGTRGGQLRPMFEGIANGTLTLAPVGLTPVPLPPSVILFGAGLLALFVILGNRRRAASGSRAGMAC